MCVAYGEDMLRGRYDNLEKALESLRALHSVVICLKKCKANIMAAGHLLQLQRVHVHRFVDAYSSNECRPKLHYSLHLAEQMQQWGRPFDAFVCERKHKNFKAICNGKLNQPGKANFARSALLELVSMELASPLNANKLATHLVGSASVNEGIQYSMASSLPVHVAAALEHRGIRYGKGQILRLSNCHALEVMNAVHDGKSYFLLVNVLEPVGDHKHPGLSQWMRRKPGQSSHALLPITDSTNSTCSQCMYVRYDNNTLWLLQ